MSDLYFPLDSGRVAWESEKNQSWNVTTVSSASGRMRSITNQLLPKRGFSITFKALTKHEVDILDSFFAIVKGSHTPFFYLDPEDNQAKNQPIPMIEPGVYQCITTSAFVEAVFCVGDVKVYRKGKEVSPDDYAVEDGLIIFNDRETVGELIADYTYYYKVVFAENSLNIRQVFDDIYTVDLQLEVVR